jgi:hypothetical protein
MKKEMADLKTMFRRTMVVVARGASHSSSPKIRCQ